MIKKNYSIEIIVKNEDEEVVCKREALTFEGAGEDLGKLERYVEKLERDEEMQIEDDDEEDDHDKVCDAGSDEIDADGTCLRCGATDLL